MKKLIKITFTLSCFLILQHSYANDGSYYTSGNHLIPMYETTIACKKEILSIKRVDKDFVNITVYYEFFNPGEAKTVEVGFEAASPSGDVDGTPIKGNHPNISNFTVSLNDVILPYKVSIVTDSIYYKDGKFIEKKAVDIVSEIKNGMEDINNVSFFYVYHFKANFKKGLNIISHTYSFKIANSIGLSYYITYILTAAKRWSNRQIDDFTLLLDMGSFQEFDLDNSFYESLNDWKIAGIGKKKINHGKPIDYNYNSSHFIIKDGFLVFQKNNFKPKGEFHLSIEYYYYQDAFDLNGKTESLNKLPFQIERSVWIKKAKDETSLKILRNLPYARRGYIFKSPEIQKFYESMDWYIPDPNYEADLSKLTKEEQEWLKILALE